MLWIVRLFVLVHQSDLHAFFDWASNLAHVIFGYGVRSTSSSIFEKIFFQV